MEHRQVIEGIESTFFHLLDPHGLRDDDLRTDPLAIDLAAGDLGVLARVCMEAFDAQPPRRGISDRRSEPDGIEPKFAHDERLAAAPRGRALHVQPGVANRGANEPAELLVLRRRVAGAP